MAGTGAAVRRVPAARAGRRSPASGRPDDPGDVAGDGRGPGGAGAGRERVDPLRASGHPTTVPSRSPWWRATSSREASRPVRTRTKAEGWPRGVGLDLEHGGVQGCVGGAGRRGEVRRQGRRGGRRPRRRSARRRRTPGARGPWPSPAPAPRAGLARRADAALDVRAQDVVVEDRQPVGELVDELRAAARQRRRRTCESSSRGSVERDGVAGERLAEGGHRAVVRTRRCGRSC